MLWKAVNVFKATEIWEISARSLWSQHQSTLGVGDANTVDLDFCLSLLYPLNWELKVDTTTWLHLSRVDMGTVFHPWKFWFRRSRIECQLFPSSCSLSRLFPPSLPFSTSPPFSPLPHSPVPSVLSISRVILTQLVGTPDPRRRTWASCEFFRL